MYTFYQSDLPNMATHCGQNACGFSIYRGVLVQWDEDQDERVLSVLDNMPSKVLGQLLAVQEHEGAISFLWGCTSVPSAYSEDGDIEIDDGDCWSVVSSKVVKQ